MRGLVQPGLLWFKGRSRTFLAFAASRGDTRILFGTFSDCTTAPIPHSFIQSAGRSTLSAGLPQSTGPFPTALAYNTRYVSALRTMLYPGLPNDVMESSVLAAVTV